MSELPRKYKYVRVSRYTRNVEGKEVEVRSHIRRISIKDSISKRTLKVPKGLDKSDMKTARKAVKILYHPKEEKIPKEKIRESIKKSWDVIHQKTDIKSIKLEGYLHPPHIIDIDGYYITDNPEFDEEEWLEAEDIDYILDNLVGKKVRITIEVIE